MLIRRPRRETEMAARPRNYMEFLKRFRDTPSEQLPDLRRQARVSGAGMAAMGLLVTIPGVYFAVMGERGGIILLVLGALGLLAGSSGLDRAKRLPGRQEFIADIAEYKRNESTFGKKCPICGSGEIKQRVGYEARTMAGSQIGGVVVASSHCNKCHSRDNVAYVCNRCTSYLCQRCLSTNR
jgi:hypothetical protein